MREAGGELRTRSCLHCVLARVLRSETSLLEGAGLTVLVSHLDPVQLPLPGGRIYRRLRRLLREAVRQGEGQVIKVAVLDLPGKSHVEVTAAVGVPGGSRVLGCAFQRHVPGTLAGGFLEGLGAS